MNKCIWRSYDPWDLYEHDCYNNWIIAGIIYWLTMGFFYHIISPPQQRGCRFVGKIIYAVLLSPFGLILWLKHR